MSFRLAKKLRVTLLVLGTGGFLFFSAQAEDKAAKPTGQKEPEKSSSSQATKQLLELSNRQDGLRKLEEELNSPFRDFSPKSSLDGAFAPPLYPPAPRQVIPNKRMQELLEKQKEWIFMTPDDLLKPPSAEDVLNVPEYGPDGHEKKKLSPLERFYQSLGKSNNKLSSKALQPEDPLSPRDLEKSDRENTSDDLPSAAKDSEKQLRKLLGVDSANSRNVPAESTRSFSDVFGLGEHALSPEQIKAHQDYIKRFQEVLNSGPPPELNGLVKPLENGQALTSTGGLPSTERSDAYDPHLGTANPTYVPSGSVDVNSKVLNSWNPNYTPPPPPVVHLAPPTPNFTPPHRIFQ